MSKVGTDPIYGYPATQAARAVSNYYKSCLRWVTDTALRGADSAQAILDQLNLDFDSAAEVNIIGLILDL
ncbi:hypothetical protein MRX96_055324 [Rhipicephalus microplus]